MIERIEFWKSTLNAVNDNLNKYKQKFLMVVTGCTGLNRASAIVKNTFDFLKE